MLRTGRRKALAGVIYSRTGHGWRRLPELRPVLRRDDGRPLTVRVDACLPQTQCGQCGYGGCIPYAEAMVGKHAPINLCPPGGQAGVSRLAALLGRPAIALDGAEKPQQRAVIDEATCIGCTLCIQACPVDAIVGSAKQMHTVIAAHCTGCELCLPPCPVECISLLAVEDAPQPPASTPPGGWSYYHLLAANTRAQARDEEAFQARSDLNKARFERRTARLQREKDEKTARLAAASSVPQAGAQPTGADDARPTTAAIATNTADAAKKAAIAAAMERARQQRAAVQPRNTEGLSDAQRAQIAAADARRAARAATGHPSDDAGDPP